MNLKRSIGKSIPGWSGSLLAHMMAWFGEPNKVHRQNRYASNDPKVIGTQLDAMQAQGIDGICLTVQGQTVNPFLHDATIKIWEACMERRMLFSFVLDPWIAENQPSPTQAVIAALQSTDYQRILDSPAYLPERFVLEFDLAHMAGVSIAAVQAAFPNVPILSWHSGFSWPTLPVNSSSPADSLASMRADNAKASMKVAGVNVMFNDAGEPMPLGVTSANFRGQRDYSQSVWGGGSAKVIDHQAGNWFYDQLAVTPATVPYIALVTWNDHDEGTGIEHVVAALNGTRIGR